MTDYPSQWQRRVLWSAFTYLAIVAAGTVAALLLVAFGRAVGFLQPVLIPFAVAAVLAFLLDPLLRWLTSKTRLSRKSSALLIFVLIALLLALMFVSVVPQIYESSVRMVQEMPAYAQKAQNRLGDLIDASQKKMDQINNLLPGAKALDKAAGRSASDSSAHPSPSPAAKQGASAASVRDYVNQQLPEMGKQVPMILNSAWHVAIRSIGGVLGVFGAALSAVIIPVYLYFLLVEGRNIARWWSEYLPIRDSTFKQEVVSVLLEINGYLTAFFRGQLMVSSIDAVLIGGSLYFFLHLDFSFFIALLVLVLTFIPYLGIILCYFPAMLIAVVQYGDWQHPFYAVLIMFIVQTLEGTIISPYIVGRRGRPASDDGHHLGFRLVAAAQWPIGAILAVPLSATVKVLLRRYVWEKSGRGRHFVPLTAASVATLQQVAREAKEAEERKAAELAAPAEPAPAAAPVAPAESGGQENV